MAAPLHVMGAGPVGVFPASADPSPRVMSSMQRLKGVVPVLFPSTWIATSEIAWPAATAAPPAVRQSFVTLDHGTSMPLLIGAHHESPAASLRMRRTGASSGFENVTVTPPAAGTAHVPFRLVGHASLAYPLPLPHAATPPTIPPVNVVVPASPAHAVALVMGAAQVALEVAPSWSVWR